MRGFIYFFCLVIILSCRNKSTENPVDQGMLNENLTEMNRRLVEEESKRIEEFIGRHSLKMDKTGTGLRYQIYEKNNGIKPSNDSQVEINYRIFLLDGTLCYTNDTVLLNIQLGKGQQIHGLEEGILLMSEGDKAKFVVPSHLAYGMNGDQNKIPPSSALFFEVELIKVVK